MLRLPQRVPRAGFFDELIAAEEPRTASLLENKRAELKARAGRAGLSREPRLCANWIGLAARYGVIDGIEPPLDDLDIEHEEGFRAAMAVVALRISRAASRGEAVDLADLRRLCERALRRPGLPEELRANAFNRYVVTSSRHRSDGKDQALCTEAVAALAAHLERERPKTFDGLLSASVLWRGLAMAPGYSEAQRDEALKSAERMAEQAAPADEPQRLLGDENLVTLLQTLAKWRGRSGPEAASACLQRMAALDPEDSTPASEIGLLEFKRQRWDQAAESFARAAALGPPGLAMNLYFHGEASLKIGKPDAAEASWRRSAALDAAGLSPRLALWRLYRERGDEHDAAALRAELMESQTLRSQLTEAELDELSGR